MATKAQLITAVRKELEDLAQANVRNIYKAKYGVKTLAVGNNTITMPVLDDSTYATTAEYGIRYYEALDEDGVDIRLALVEVSRTTSSFVIYSPTTGTLKWETFLLVPNFNFWT